MISALFSVDDWEKMTRCLHVYVYTCRLLILSDGQLRRGFRFGREEAAPFPVGELGQHADLSGF